MFYKLMIFKLGILKPILLPKVEVGNSNIQQIISN